MKHKYHKCDKNDCSICEGGLLYCEVCHLGEVELVSDECSGAICFNCGLPAVAESGGKSPLPLCEFHAHMAQIAGWNPVWYAAEHSVHPTLLESAPLETLSTPEHSATSQTDQTPPQRG